MKLNPQWLHHLLLLPSWLAMAWLASKASWFWNSQPDLQFGWIVLLLVCYLFWEAWEARPRFVLKWRWPNVLALASAAPFLFLFQIYQQAYGLTASSMSALALGVMMVIFSNLHFVFGWEGARRFGFAFLFILIAIPIPGVIYGPIVTGLQQKVATVTVETMNLIGIPARRLGSVIQLPTGAVGVDEACSGIRSLQSTVMATLFIGYLTLSRFWLQALLFAGGIVLAVFGNLIRAFYLSYTANRDGVGAIDQVHDTAGWSILIFTAAGVMGLAWLLGKGEGWIARHAPKLEKSGTC